jgi:hypothetical protein
MKMGRGYNHELSIVESDIASILPVVPITPPLSSVKMICFFAVILIYSIQLDRRSQEGLLVAVGYPLLDGGFMLWTLWTIAGLRHEMLGRA